MLRNYLKTAFRILLRQKSYSAINIFGLTLGITSTLLLILFIMDELSYDRFHQDANRIYRSTFFGKLQGQEFTTTQTGIPMAEAMMKDIPDGQLFWIIKNGSPGTGMMAFSGLPDEQVWQLVQYIRSLAK